MTIEIYRDLLSHLGKKAKVAVSSAEGSDSVGLKQYSFSLPVDFYRVITTCWPVENMIAGPYELYPLGEIISENESEELKSRGFFVIGGALNGDPLAIRLGNKWASETSVCLLSHEHLIDKTHPDECSAEIAADFSEFLYRAVEERYLPRDFFCAQEFLKLKRKYGPEPTP